LEAEAEAERKRLAQELENQRLQEELRRQNASIRITAFVRKYSRRRILRAVLSNPGIEAKIKFPDIISIRDTRNNQNTVFHTLAYKGILSKSATFVPTVSDLQLVNSLGHSVLMASVLSLQYTEVVSLVKMFEAVDNSEPELSGPSPALDGIIASGWLSFSNDGVQGPWKNYFVDLHREMLKYYADETRGSVKNEVI